MRIVETQSRDLRQGIPVNFDDAWKQLDHPALTRILTSSKLSQLMARREHQSLRRQLETIPDEELFSPELIDISWPALIMTGMENKSERAEEIVKTLLPSLIAGATRKLDFTSIRLVEFSDAKRGEVIVFICPVEPHQDYIKRRKSECYGCLLGDDSYFLCDLPDRIFLKGPPI